jgi:hypothetical protein
VRVVRVLETLAQLRPYAGRTDTKQICNRADQKGGRCLKWLLHRCLWRCLLRCPVTWIHALTLLLPCHRGADLLTDGKPLVIPSFLLCQHSHSIPVSLPKRALNKIELQAQHIRYSRKWLLDKSRRGLQGHRPCPPFHSTQERQWKQRLHDHPVLHIQYSRRWLKTDPAELQDQPI